MKCVNDQLHMDNNTPANTLDAFLHTPKRVRHANTLCFNVYRNVDSHKGHSEIKGARDCLKKMEIGHNHIEVSLFQPLLGVDVYIYLVA